jgi:hypothetical protein
VIYYEWLGNASDAQPFFTSSTGTGQSGTVAVTTTANNVLTRAEALALTEQTSSGSGESTGSIALPHPLGYKKLRLTWVFRVLMDDTDFYSVTVLMDEYDGTNVSKYEMAMQSDVGSTEQIKYRNSANTLVDTGFTYPTDQGFGGRGWHRAGMDISLEAKTYTRLAFDSEFDISTIDSYSVANASAECINISISCVAKTVLSTALFDSIVVEVLE